MYMMCGEAAMTLSTPSNPIGPLWLRLLTVLHRTPASLPTNQAGQSPAAFGWCIDFHRQCTSNVVVAVTMQLCPQQGPFEGQAGIAIPMTFKCNLNV